MLGTSPWFGAILPYLIAFLLIGVALRFLLRHPATQRRVHDPYHMTAHMAQTCGAGGGSFNKKTYDTVICGSCRFDRLPDRRKLLEHFMEHVVPHQQMHCMPSTNHPVTGAEGSPYIVWEQLHQNVDDKNVIESRHFVYLSSSGRDETERIVTKIVNEPRVLRDTPNVPWWRVYLISESDCDSANGGGSGGGGVMVIQIHHALADGLSCLRVFTALLSTEPDRMVPMDTNVFAPRDRSSSGGGGTARGKKNKLASFLLNSVLLPLVKFWRWPVLIWKVIDFFLCVAETVMYFFGPFDTATKLVPSEWRDEEKMPEKFGQVIVNFPPHSLELIKKIKNAASKQLFNDSSSSSTAVTVNDVEFALNAGMFRRYLLKYGNNKNNDNNDKTTTAIDSDSAHFSCITPFAMPHHIPAEKQFTHTMCNSFSFMINNFPVGGRDRSAKDRLFASHKSWERLKHSLLVPVAFLTGQLFLRFAPLSLRRFSTRQLFRRKTFLFSNLPGPTTDMFLCGEKIKEVRAVHMLPIPMGITVSMNGQMNTALTTPQIGEPGTESDVRIALPKCFQEELDALCSELNIQ